MTLNKTLTLTLTLALAGCAESYDCNNVESMPESVAQSEELAALGVLKSYVPEDFVLGLNVGATDYSSEELTYSIALTNFNAIIDHTVMTYAATVNDEGVYDFSGIGGIIKENAPAILGSTLYAYNTLKTAQFEALVAPTYYPSTLVDGKYLIMDFENLELGTSFEMTKGSVCAVEEDPAGQSGHVLHIGSDDDKANASYPLFNVSLPDGITLGNCRTVVFDFRGGKSSGLTGNVRLGINDVEKSYQRPQQYGCPDGDWGREVIELDLASFEFTDEEKAMTEFTMYLGSNYRNGNYYIDNVAVLWQTGEDEKYIEKTIDEQSEVLTEAMHNWINGLMAVTAPLCQEYVVIADAISDTIGVVLRNGESEGLATGGFYLNDYQGDNFARQLIKTTRDAYSANGGNGQVKLFVSESNLFGNLEKTSNLVYQISEWEADGQTKIDGIVVNLPLSGKYSSTEKAVVEENITALLTELKNTGKSIRLDNVSLMSSDGYSFYGLVLGKYMSIIPANQRGGIIFAGRSELWDNNYSRTQAYKETVEAISK